jgi:hypothetical protein
MMPEHDDLAPPHEPAGHGCTCGAHEITSTCPVDCLRPMLATAAAFNLLARAWGAPFDPPATAGDVADLYQQRRLSQIRGLGPRRHSEIGHGLRLAGLISAQSSSHPEPAPSPAATAASPDTSPATSVADPRPRVRRDPVTSVTPGAAHATF